MDNKKIISLIIVLVIICLILVGVICVVSSLDDKNILTQGNISEVVATVNGEEIKRFDINYRKYINKNSEKDEEDIKQKNNDETVKNELIQDKVLLQEAKKNNIDIDENEKQTIRKSYEDSMTDGDKMTATKIGMTQEEYLNYIVEKQIEDKVIAKIKTDIFTKLTNGEIHIDDEEFNKKYEEYQNYKAEDLNEEVNNKFAILQEASDIYVNYLVKNSEIK